MEFNTKLNNTMRYPTSLLIRGADALGIEIAKSLLEQGGYVIIVDNDTAQARENLAELRTYKLLTVLDYSALPTLDDDIRRLDYVFYFQHGVAQLGDRISSQEFLQYSNYLDAVLDLTTKFDAKFLLTTSIKAHQLILSQDMGFNYSGGAQEKNSSYTELETQRYAESLVKEYQEKVGIDARVLRLGTILGKGLEIDENSALIKMINQALKGDNLVVPGDGLENEHYVHYLDAAYGIIKGQFSLNTKSRIYTLANEEEISILSIAYKLLEIIPYAKEIRFAEDDGLPPLRIYKPAENLSNIGWKPRISFERALAQTVEFLKDQYNTEKKDNTLMALNDGLEDGQTQLPVKRKKGIKEKVLDFFFIAEAGEAIAANTNADGILEMSADSGPLARLINERKLQERARKGSIILANNRLKDKLKPEKHMTVLNKVDGAANDMFAGLKSRFEFLKYVTLADFIFSTLALIAFLIVYFVIISPSFSLGRNLVSAAIDMKTLSASADIAANRKLSGNIKTNLNQAQERVSELEFMFNVFRSHDYYIRSQKLLSNLEQYFAGYEETFTALTPYQTYLNKFDAGLTYRFNDNNILAVAPQQEYATELTGIKDNLAVFNIGVDRISKAQPSIIDELKSYPDWMEKYYTGPIQTLEAKYKEITFLQKTYFYLPTLLGLDKPRYYLIVVQDNARYTASGGEVAGYFIFQVKNGAITDVRVKNFGQFTDVYSTISSEALEEIKLVSSTTIDTTNVKPKNISLINNETVFLKTIKEFAEEKEGLKFDLTTSLNLQVLEQLIKSQGEIEFRSSKINADNLLTSINLLQGDSKTDLNRNDVIVNVWAKVLEQELNNLGAGYTNLSSIFGQGTEDRDVRYYTADPALVNFSYLLDEPEVDVKDRLDFGLNYDQKTNTINKYPVQTLSLKVQVKKDLSTSKTVTLTVSGPENMQNTFICFPSGTSIESYVGAASNITSEIFNREKLCSLFLADDDLKYGVTANSLPFEISAGNSYNYKLLLTGNPGISSNYDVEFSFDAGFTEVTPEDQSFIKQGNTYIYSASFRGSKSFSFKLK